MYAFRRHYVSKRKNVPSDEQYDVRVTRDGKPEKDINYDRIIRVDEETMSWNEATHIHKWFVDNVQDGNDDAKEHFVSCGLLQELHDLCDQVITASKLVDGIVYTETVDDTDQPDGVVQRTSGKVIEDPAVAKKLLPIRSGCFFGAEVYDERYLKATKDTRDWAAQMLADCENGVRGNNYYSSSWQF